MNERNTHAIEVCLDMVEIVADTMEIVGNQPHWIAKVKAIVDAWIDEYFTDPHDREIARTYAYLLTLDRLKARWEAIEGALH